MNLIRRFSITAVWLLFFAVVFQGVLEAQYVPSKERGDPTKRRKTNIDGNLVRTTIFNWGQTGRTGVVPDEIPYEWPKNTRQMYIALTGILVGAEVRDESGQRIYIVDVPNYRQSPSGESWNFEPVPGYFKEIGDSKREKIAKSDDRNTWPDFWPDKSSDPTDPGWRGAWNGFFGKDQFNADQEMYYRASDDLYDRYNYFPDSTDLLRRGMGIIFDKRVLAWSQVLVNDVVFILHFIKNDGTKDLDKVAITIWIADLVGGDGDSNDDKPYYDLINDVAWSTDSDGRGNRDFGTTPVGVAATSFLETPGNSVNGIDDDGDGEEGNPFVAQNMLLGEDPTNGLDDNGNGLIDENQTHIPFGTQRGVAYRDRIDNNGNGEAGSPVVTLAMLSGETPENAIDDNNNGAIDEDNADVGRAYADGIDNDGNGELNSPVMTQAMIDAASSTGGRYTVRPGLVLYNVGAEDLGKPYRDGIDNDGNGIVDEGIDEGIDEMIDESREDGIDNDGDWNALLDDVGLDGKAGTGDSGEGDGKPTSGAGTNFPGEPNIDKTDVSEGDQIGITNAQYTPAGSTGIGSSADVTFWIQWMIPGKFYDPTLTLLGEYDLFVGSGVFPIKAGQTERISMAVNLGTDVADALRNKETAQKAYDSDYRFATAPLAPTVTAVPGDGRVTLYWNDEAENSFDSFLARLGEDGYDFEGYKVYRATSAAFLDAKAITDAEGNAVYYKPVAQYDRINGIKGLHPVDLNGAAFYLGNDTGLLHSFVDSTVQNGQKYFYAVTAYDRGLTIGNIGPSETPIAITLDPTGNAVLGKNVVEVTPNPPAAGYEPATLGRIDLVAGTTTGTIGYTIVDPRSVREDNTYTISFEDTLLLGTVSTPDTLRTKSFTLVNITNPLLPDTLIRKSRDLAASLEQPLTEGFRLVLLNETLIRLNRERSRWSRPGVFDFDLQLFTRGFVKGQQKPSDYRVVVGPVGMDTSVAYRVATVTEPAVPVNFSVYNISENNKKIKFGFKDFNGNGMLDTSRITGSLESDVVVFLEEEASGALAPTWKFQFLYDSTEVPPAAGDTATLLLRKPFLKQDLFQFTTSAPRIDAEQAREQLDKIKVVPNPYVAASTWEPRNPFSSGRGPREIHFNHLPQRCTIRIYTVSGELVRTLEHESAMDNGTEVWDVLTKDNLSVSYGVYIYHIDAPGVGEKIGKLAIIK